MVPLLNIPILSVVLMLLAGILIGHLIWYRDRSDDEAALVGLRGENHDLQAALHEHKQAYAELEVELEHQHKERDRLKTANKELLLSAQDMELERAEAASELSRLQQLKDQAFHDLDQERQQRRSLQDALIEAEESMAGLRTATEQLQGQVASYQSDHDQLDQATQAQLKQQHATIDELTAQRDAALRQAADQGDALARMVAELRARQEDLESLRQDREEMQLQVDEERAAREKLQHKVSQIDNLVAQRDAAIERASTWSGAVEELQRQLAASNSDKTNIEQAHDELVALHEKLRSENESIRHELEAVAATLVDERSRLSQMEAENRQLSRNAAQHDQLKQRQEAASELAARLQYEADARQQDLETLRSELQDTAAQLGRERHQREHLQSVLQERSAEVAALLPAREELAVLRTELATAQASLQEHTREVESCHARLEAVNAELSGSQQEHAELRAAFQTLTTRNQQLGREAETLAALRGEHESVKRMLADKSQECDALRRGRETAALDLEHTRETLQELQQELAALAAANSDQQTEMEKIRGGAADYAALKATLNEQTERLRKLTAQRDEAVTELSKSQDAIRELESRAEAHAREFTAQRQQFDHQTSQWESRLRANEETIRNLRRERGAVITRVRPPASASPAAVPFATASGEEDARGGRLRRDEVLGMVYTQPPRRKDDLKRISGIAHVLEKKLNAFGVYTYEQVMQWDAVAIEEFSKLLSFRDRIQRDDWVGQARDLYHEHHGRAA